VLTGAAIIGAGLAAAALLRGSQPQERHTEIPTH
jgi:hypothetical protein